MINKNYTLEEEINSIELLSQEEITNLFIKYEKTQDKKERQIIENTVAYHNIRLIRDFILKNWEKLGKTGYTFEELISIGYIGLIDAAKRYDYKKGYNFSTFAYSYIKKELYANLFTCKPVIQVKRASTNRIIAYRKFVINYYEEHGKDPSDEEIVEALKITIDGLKKLRLHIKLMYTISIDEIFKLKYTNEESGIKLGNIITYDEEPMDEMVIFNLDKKEHRGLNFKSLINNSHLTEREKKVITLKALKKLTFDEIGEIEGVSRETVRKSFVNGIKKLKRNRDVIDYKKYGK